ncbi:MAG TPA: molybdopterin-dependent oxidoreductase [Candidatus Acidoferrum sp.]|nr:molybdopterin-dependent oxidoreductase [Candidatus Acidoferrum sp.]
MTREINTALSRRNWLRTSLIAGGALLAGFDRLAWSLTSRTDTKNPFRGGKKLGVVGFVGELPIEMGAVIGAELDGRLYSDLSSLTPEDPVTRTTNFYLRTCASNLLEGDRPWVIRLGGLMREPTPITLARLKAMEQPMGVHLMECAGNTREFHFGLMSAASWTGVPISDVLKSLSIEPRATRVLVSGFDKYQATSATSRPGASWIFKPDELTSSRAFLATQMNGEPLTRDHGAPVRLVVPGWYGCACIKWVDEITLVADDAPATSQMQEYAARTHQQGVPELARDFRPAIIQHAAMPIRVERWSVNNAIMYRIVGILWGGLQRVRVLEIRFNPEYDYVLVDHLDQTDQDSWSFWTHAWTPQKPGSYLIRLRVKDPIVPTARLDAGYYVRAVDIAERG